MNNAKHIKNLKAEIKRLENMVKSSFCIRDDDEYQEQLEIRWQLADLKEELASYE